MTPLLSKKMIPVLVWFLLINVVLIIFRDFLSESGFKMGFLFVANFLLFILTFLGFYIQIKGIKSSNINAFIRGIYSSLLLKMFVIVVAIIIYVLVMKGEVNISSLLAALVFYLVYTTLEVIQLMKIARRKPDA